MTKRYSLSLFRRISSFLLAVYLFNFSIDSRDAHPNIAEDLSFNDIESVYEFFAEEIFGFENAVAEHDENDPEDGGSLEFKKFYCPLNVGIKAQINISFVLKITCPEDNQQTSGELVEIYSPPPQV